jgi:hypothetical protein
MQTRVTCKREYEIELNMNPGSPFMGIMAERGISLLGLFMFKSDFKKN